MGIDVNMTNLLKKWDPLLKEGTTFRSERIKKATAILLENQMNHMKEAGLIQESAANTTGQAIFNTGSYATDGSFHKIAIPMVRRTFPEIVAHDLVGVQPLTGPVGLAFAMRFRAGQTYAGAQNAELGYNTIDKNYTGTYSLSAGEALGSNTMPSPGGVHAGAGGGLGVGTGQAIKEVNLTIEKAQVEAQTRKLRSRWSLEVAQDLKAMHDLDIESEMMDILSYEITAEIDHELMDEIRNAANQNANSNIAGKLGVLDWTNAAHFDGRWEHEKYRNLYNLMIRKANRIAIDTRRGAANFAVVDPTVAACLEATSVFTIAPVNTDIATGTNGVARIGSLEGRMNVFRDTFATSNEFVLGYKGPSSYDAGIIYLPYIPLMISKAQFEDSFHPVVGVMTRYGITTNMWGSHLYYVRGQIIKMP